MTSLKESMKKEIEMSAEDRKFMEMSSSSITLKDSHYDLPLPFFTTKMLPSNHDRAVQRVLNLTRKFKKDTFLCNIVQRLRGRGNNKKSYVEKVPQEQLLPEKGKVWYLLHHEAQRNNTSGV